MQQATYGIFRKGTITLKEPVNAPDESDVIVVFLEKKTNKKRQSGNALLKIFDTLGTWEDSRDTEEIITEIRKSRISRNLDIAL